MIPFILAIAGGYLIGDSAGSEKFADGGTMWRVSPTTMEEDMKEAKELIGDDKWKAMSKSDRVKLTKYLKFKGDIGLPGQEEDIETVSGLQYYKDGGVVGDRVRLIEMKPFEIRDKGMQAKRLPPGTMGTIVSVVFSGRRAKENEKPLSPFDKIMQALGLGKPKIKEQKLLNISWDNPRNFGIWDTYYDYLVEGVDEYEVLG